MKKGISQYIQCYMDASAIEDQREVDQAMGVCKAEKVACEAPCDDPRPSL